ncbi:MAG: T9SS type A sorting domain-containing protein [Candidatus Cloacimonadaceae bacterium]|nr:T9SS type A sorting domain-containing protein [Candidatus Cloacimonadaceae bacterium]
MKKMLCTMLIAVSFLLILQSLMGMALQYGGTVQVPGNYTTCAFHDATGQMRFYRLVTGSPDGFGLESFYVDPSLQVSSAEMIHQYTHPTPFADDGGTPTLVLSQSFMSHVYFLQRNSTKLFMTVVNPDLQVHTVIIQNEYIAFDNSPLKVQTFCFLTPELMAVSYQQSVYLLNLSDATLQYFHHFPDGSGRIRISRVNDTLATVWKEYVGTTNTGFLINYQNGSVVPFSHLNAGIEIISENLGNNYYIGRQMTYNFDPPYMVRTLLLKIPEPSNWIYPLYYGGSTDFFNYTPMHTFTDIQPLGDKFFLAICSDLQQIPFNRKIGYFFASSISVIYIWDFMPLYDLPSADHLYKLRDGYYLSIHASLPMHERVKLLDVNAQTISLPDTNVLYVDETIYPGPDGSFYATINRETVHYYSLAPVLHSDPTSIESIPIQLYTYPNPFRDTQTIRLEGGSKAPISVSVYDLRGRKVRSFVMDGTINHHPEITWDAKDDNGKRLSSGIYLLRASQNGNTSTRKLVLMD